MGEWVLVREVTLSTTEEQAWAVLSDYARDTAWRRDVKEMRQEPPGPVHAGARTHERLDFLGQRHRVVAEVTSVGPGRRLTFRSVESDVPTRGERAVLPAPGGCRVRWEIRLAPRGVMRLFGVVLAWAFARGMSRDLRTFARLVESPAGARSLVPSRG